MRFEPPPPFDPTLLRLANDVRRLGHDTNEKDERGQPVWVKVRHGVLAPAASWRLLTVEHRHAAFVNDDAANEGRARGAVAHLSGGAVGLPRVTSWPKRVELISPARSSGLIVRHDLTIEGAVEVAGLNVTSLGRTVVDLGRTEDVRDAVAAADHALHHGLCTRAALEAEFDCLDPGVPGRAMARLVLDLADGRSMSVGESLSRVQMFLQNLPRPQLQVKVVDGEGVVGYGDFGWRGVVGEFDGRMKYRVPEGADPRVVQEVLWREKRREDRIRGAGNKVARWVWTDATAPTGMLRLLGAQGIRPAARSTWFDDDATAWHPRRPDAA